MLNLLKRLIREESGQSMVEYGLIIALVAVVAIAVLVTLGDKIKESFQRVVGALEEALGEGAGGGGGD